MESHYTKQMKKPYYFLVFFALYPVTTLYSLNVSEVNIIYIVRPLLISLAALLILTGLSYLIFRSKEKAAVLSTIGFIVFTSYGAFYNIVKGQAIGGFIIGRHKFLFPVVILLTVLAIWFVAKRMHMHNPQLIQAFNVLSILLIGYSLVQIGLKYQQINVSSNENPYTPISQTDLAPSTMPDVYYFILDSYARADYIMTEMKYDNTPFLNELKKRGFYIGDCSLSNYSYTRLSLASSMNMEYLEDLGLNVAMDDKDESKLDPYILHPKIRSDFEQAGYKTVAFETGYRFTEWNDADYFFRPYNNPLTMPVLSGFEGMAIQNTGVSAFLQNQSISRFLGLSFPYNKKWELAHFIIDKVKEIPELSGNKLVFIHLVTTHRPYIFTSDGDKLRDERYYANDGVPINDEFYVRGFQQQLEFTNTFMLEVIDQIQKNSSIPPVIIIQGDHGVRAPGRISILNALLIPGLTENLYPSISPVNSFRFVENTVLGKNFEPLPDKSYFSRVNVAPYDIRLVEDDDPCMMK